MARLCPEIGQQIWLIINSQVGVGLPIRTYSNSERVDVLLVCLLVCFQELPNKLVQKTFGEYGSTCVQDLASERFCVFAKDVSEIVVRKMFIKCASESAQILSLSARAFRM